MLIVIAEKEELKLIEQFGYSQYPVLITGPGGVNVINALKDLPKDTEILNIGYCGSNNIDIGRAVRVTRVGTNYELAKFGEPPLNCSSRYCAYDCEAVCYSSTDFVTSTNKQDPCVFDMELAFIRAMFDNVSAIKVVSDNLSIHEYRDNL